MLLFVLLHLLFTLFIYSHVCLVSFQPHSHIFSSEENAHEEEKSLDNQLTVKKMSAQQLLLQKKDLCEQMEELDDEIRLRGITGIHQHCISSDVCVICRTRIPDVIVKPCFHKCFCYPCLFEREDMLSGRAAVDDNEEELYRFFDTSSPSVHKCSVCRCKISQFVYDGDGMLSKFVTESPHSDPATFHERGRQLAEQQMQAYTGAPPE